MCGIAGIIAERPVNPLAVELMRDSFSTHLPVRELWFTQRLADEVERVIEDPSFAAAGCWTVGWRRCFLGRVAAEASVSGLL